MYISFSSILDLIILNATPVGLQMQVCDRARAITYTQFARVNIYFNKFFQLREDNELNLLFRRQE